MVISAGLVLLFNLFVAQRVEREPPKYPLAVGESPRVPPEPRLRRFPREDIMNFRIGEEAALHQYGWVDRNAGIVRIPIDEAMRLTLERGLPARPQDPAQIAEAELEKEGQMSERQALALLESMKDEEARVRLDERRVKHHVYNDW